MEKISPLEMIGQKNNEWHIKINVPGIYALEPLKNGSVKINYLGANEKEVGDKILKEPLVESLDRP